MGVFQTSASSVAVRGRSPNPEGACSKGTVMCREGVAAGRSPQDPTEPSGSSRTVDRWSIIPEGGFGRGRAGVLQFKEDVIVEAGLHSSRGQELRVLTCSLGSMRATVWTASVAPSTT
jgi:hypothetical protein